MATSAAQDYDPFCGTHMDDCESLRVPDRALSPVKECSSDDSKPVQVYLPSVAKFCHPNTYFNSARNGVYRRFSMCDWDESYDATKKMADTQRRIGQNIRADIFGTIRETNITRNIQCRNTKKLGEKAFDTGYWKDELVGEVGNMETEILALMDQRRLLEKAIEDVRKSLVISEECILQRERRTGIELVRDDVERSLSREINMMRKALDDLERMHDKCSAQLKLDRAAQHNVDFDARDKQHAQSIDERMHRLNNSSIEIAYHDGVEYNDNTVTKPKTWLKFTRENLCRAQRERQRSGVVRAQCERLIRVTSVELWKQVQIVNRIIAIRIAETNDARQKLLQHVERVIREKQAVEEELENLRNAIREKESFIKVAQTRLEERTHRLGAELCHDKPMIGLQREIHELRNAREKLKEKILDAELALTRLDKTKSILLNDIAVKTNSLEIDSQELGSMRKGIHIEPCIGVSFIMPRCEYDSLRPPKC